MKNAVLSFIRHAFTAVGTFGALYGGTVRHDKLETLCGAVLALVGAGWGIFDEWKAERTPPKPEPKDDKNNYPQSPLIVAAFVTLGLLFSSCALLQPTVESVNGQVRGAVKALSLLVLKHAVSEQDFQDKKDLIGGLSAFVGTLATGEDLTDGQIKTALGRWLPDKTHWKELADGIALAADLVRPVIGKDAGAWINFWGQVALGLSDAFYD
ncbi:MAG: hypothetical protein LBH01_02000 [Verrucomicrobiales bacterium]|jgi:hypothetical protein|nr:hypothetical protein [Verrucomicrobiales bacterium]